MRFLIPILFILLFSESFQAFAIGTYGVTWFEISMVMFIILVLKRVLWNGEKLRVSLNPAWFFFFFLILSVFISGLKPLAAGSGDMIVQYFKTTLHFFFLTSFAFLAAVYPLDSKTWERAVKAWLIVSIAINIFGIYQIMARAFDLPLAWISSHNVTLLSRGHGTEEEFKQLSLRYEGFFRATSIFPEPSSLAAFNTYILIFTVIPFVQKTGSFLKSKFLTFTAFFWGILGLFLAFSLTGLVGASLVIGAAFLFEKVRHKFRTMMIMLAGAAVLIVGADYFVKSYSNQSVLKLFQKRIEGIVYFSTGKKKFTVGESYGMRRDYAEESVKIWQDHPAVGIGMGLTSYYRESEIGFAMYSILAALSELGILGGMAFAGLFISLYLITIRYIINHSNYKDYPPPQRRLTGILFYVMLLQFVINFLSGNNLVTTALWAPMALILASVNKTYIDEGKKFITVSILRKPLKVHFEEALKAYRAKKTFGSALKAPTAE